MIITIGHSLSKSQNSVRVESNEMASRLILNLETVVDYGVGEYWDGKDARGREVSLVSFRCDLDSAPQNTA